MAHFTSSKSTAYVGHLLSEGRECTLVSMERIWIFLFYTMNSNAYLSGVNFPYYQGIC